MIAYIIKSSLSLLLLFGLYWFLLRKEKLFIFNRFFLVSSVVFSLFVPFISIPVNFQSTPRLEDIIPTYNNVIPEVGITENTFVQNVDINQSYIKEEPSSIDMSAILLALYLSGVVFFLVRFLRNVYLIIHRIKVSDKIRFEGYRIVLTSDKTGPYCFFSNIFLNRDDYLNGKIDKELLNHELEHIKQSHTIDIIVIELVKIFYWFNPVHLLYDRAIRINHEYLADNGVISHNNDMISYADKLLKFITCRSNIPLTSGSNHSLTKMRLMMMTKSGSGSFINRTRIAMTLCMGTVLFLLLSFQESDEQTSLPDLSETVTVMAQNPVRGIVMAENGKPLFGAIIKCTGTDDMSYETIADFDGRFTLNDVKSGATLLFEYRGFKSQIFKADFESEMVVKLVRDPDFNGRVFISEVQNVNFRNSDFTPAKALVVIDGMIIDFRENFIVDPGEIKSFRVLKDKEATDKYGNKAKDGAVEIILYGNKTGSVDKKLSDKFAPDSSKYKTNLGVNRTSNKGERINIPFSNLQYVSVWTSHDIDNTDKKESRSISIMTRDYYKVKGRVVRENGKSLTGVKISATDNPVTEISDKKGRFQIEDVREGALLEFSLPGYKTYYLSTSFEVAFNEELTIELKKDKDYEEDEIIDNSPNFYRALPVVDDLIYDKMKMGKYDPPEIVQFHTLERKYAIDKYGEKRGNGVILITTKRRSTESETNINSQQKTEKPEKSVKPDEVKDIVIAPVKMNILYRGIANPIKIKFGIAGDLSSKVTLTTTNGTINRNNNYVWEIFPGDLDESVITVLVDNKKVTEKKFRVENIPNPVALFAGKTNGAISKDDRLKVKVLEAKLKDFDWDLTFKIESFKLLYKKDNIDMELSSEGNKLTDSMRLIIADLARDQSIIFKDIKAIGPDGRIRDLNPIILKIK